MSGEELCKLGLEELRWEIEQMREEDRMSSDFSNERQINKTRKPHRCFGCREIIPAGSPAMYCSGVWEGDFSSAYYCMPCEEFIKDPANQEIWSEGIYAGDIGDYRREKEAEGQVDLYELLD